MSSDLSDVVAGVLPIVILIALGMLLRRARVLDDPTVAGLKRLIVNVALPAVLFTTFLRTSFQPAYLWVVLIVFAVCVGLYGVGRLALRLAGGSPYLPFLFTGFELGMVGFALFTAVYGVDDLPALGVLALGHEVFIWFVFVTLLRAAGAQRQSAAQTARNLLTSPTIVAILLGLALNFAGLGAVVTDGPVGGAIGTALGYLAGMIVPLILLIVGYGSRLSRAGIRSALPLVAVRTVVTLGLALLIGIVVFQQVLGLEPIFRHALVALMVLPPPFVIPLFIPAARRDDLTYVNNVLSMSSLVSITVFLGYVLLTA